MHASMAGTAGGILVTVLGAFALVACEKPAQRQHAGKLSLPDPLAAGWQGKKVCELLLENARQRILRCAFPPGVGHERHFHAPHAGYALRGGTMEITDQNGTRVVEVPAGTTWISDGITWHEALNVGRTTSEYLLVETTPGP